MTEDRELLHNQYKDISQELNLKTEALRRFKHKVKALEKEISDIQSEFEGEREDYLESIRKQDRQIKLLNQIIEKIASTLKKECNYRYSDLLVSFCSTKFSKIYFIKCLVDIYLEAYFIE